MGTDNIRLLFKLAREGDMRALGRLLSVIESDPLKSLSLNSSDSPALRIGITGPPGAGKSSIVNLLIKHYRQKNYRVGVLAVDPSSPFTGGAILGDRIRMPEHASDSQVFIRSLSSRGMTGGLSAATGAMARALENCGFDLILIESVGVGQTELEVMNLADTTALILVPESGDFVQTLKAGILEIADTFVVNKSDRPGADVLAQDLSSLIEIENKKRTVFMTTAVEETGIENLAAHLLHLAQAVQKNSTKQTQRLRAELRSWLLLKADQKIQKAVAKLKASEIPSAYKRLSSKV